MAESERWRFSIRELMVVVAATAIGSLGIAAAAPRDRWIALLWIWLMLPLPACALSWWRTLEDRRGRRGFPEEGGRPSRYMPAPEPIIKDRLLDDVVQILTNVLGIVWLLTVALSYTDRPVGVAEVQIGFCGLLLLTILLLSLLDGAWLRAGAIAGYLTVTIALLAMLN